MNVSKTLQILANLKFAIFLLILISITITIGSIIEQDQSLDYYKINYPLENPIGGFINWKFIIFFQLNQIYKNIWFFSLLGIFGASLLSCTFLQQFPVIKFSRRCYFVKNLKKIDFKTEMSTKNITIIVGEAIKNGYFIFQQRKNYYCVKGLIGRIAPVFVHLSIILILFGSIIASIGGFNAQELIGKSEIFYIQNVVSSGSISKFPQQAIRVNDFWINYYKNNKIKQFYSNISLLNENGKEIINKTISVNKPLIYRNLTFYQTDWNLLGLRFSNKNNFFEIPFITNLQNGNKVWLTWLPTKQNVNNIFNGNLIIVNNYKGKIYVYDKNGRIINKIDLNDFLIENNYQLIEFLTVTGIQIKSDPGVIFIYAGFAFLMVSTLLSYLSFSQIWLIIKNYQKQKNLIIGAKTNRTKIFLNTELFKLTKNKNE